MGIDKKLVLVIDDSDEARVVLRKILEARGCHVIEAETVADGLDQARAKAPHLVICDLKMPGQSGFDFLQERLKDPKLTKMPVIVASGVTDSKLISSVIALKSCDYIVKPFNTKTVLQKVRKHLADSSFLKHSFKEDRVKPVVSVKGFGLITHIHDSGMKFKSPIRLRENFNVKIDSKALKVLGLESKKLTTSPYVPFFDDRQYESRVSFVGITSEEAKNIKSKMRKLG